METNPVEINRRVFAKICGAVAGELLIPGAFGALSREAGRTTHARLRLNPLRLEAVDLREHIHLVVKHIYEGAIDRRRLKVRVNSQARSPAWKKDELALGKLTPDSRVEITFEQVRRQTQEAAPGYTTPFEIEWLGDTIVAMQPETPGRIALY